MKTKFGSFILARYRQVVFALAVAVIGSALTGRMTAQTFRVLHDFTNSPEGAGPEAAFLLSSNVFYGTTVQGGAFGYGTVFRINPDGTGLTNLHSFAPYTNFINNDGAIPTTGVLALSGNALYGITFYGGTGGNGVVYRVNTDGTGFTNLHSFAATVNNGSTGTNSEGAQPQAGLIILGNTLYGDTSAGGLSGNGSVYAINTDGTGFTNLYNFGQSPNDGAGPQGGLVVFSNVLYGTTRAGGNSTGAGGIIFKINTNGTGYTILHNFDTFTDGMAPNDMIVSGNTLYGTAAAGGVTGFDGSVFSFNVTNLVFKKLHYFNGTDGDNLQGGVTLVGNTLYGTAAFGGSASRGTLFSVNTDGTGFTNLHTFTATSGTKSTNSDGSTPDAGLVYSGGTLYGTASAGGTYGAGTMFTISLPITPPQLTIISAGTNVLLTWPTNATGFTLEFATNLASVWNTDSTPPVIVNQQNVVTNSISGTQMFFRLSQPVP